MKPSAALSRLTRACAAAAALSLAGAAIPARAACLDVAAPGQPAATAPKSEWLRAYRAGFRAPTRLAIDGSGRVYVADATGGRVVVRNRDGSVHSVADGLGEPAAIAVDAFGWIYVGDRKTGRVAVFDQSWRPLAELGSGEGELGQPGDIAVDAASGEVFVTDTARHEVAVFPRAGGPRLRTYGGEGAEDGRFRTPTGVALAGDDLLVADQLNYRIQVLDKASGAFKYCIGKLPTSPSFFNPDSGVGRNLGMVQGLWADAAGRLFVADAVQGSVLVLDRLTGTRLGEIGAFGEQAGGLRVPTDLVLDDGGRLFVASANNARVEIYGLDQFADPERFIPALAGVSPTTLDRAALPPTVEVSLRIPGYRLSDLDAGSLRINGLAPQATSIADRDADGEPDLLLLVPAGPLLATLGGGETGTITVTGQTGLLQAIAHVEIALTGTANPDSDGDGVPDDADLCPGTAAGRITDGAGCAVVQLCPCAGPRGGGVWRNHGQFMKCVVEETRELRAAGRLTPKQAAALVFSQARRGCGWHRHAGRD